MGKGGEEGETKKGKARTISKKHDWRQYAVTLQVS